MEASQARTAAESETEEGVASERKADPEARSRLEAAGQAAEPTAGQAAEPAVDQATGRGGEGDGAQAADVEHAAVPGEEQASPPPGIHLRLDGVAKSFGDKQVLQAIELEVQPGEFLAIVGRSGCGKSTLLRLVAGLEQATEGSVQLNGKESKSIHPDVRVLFQDARLLPWKRVISNVRIGVKERLRWKAEEALRQVGLLDRAQEWPEVLSGGQRQRVALARALAGEPRLLLLDEPLGALDALTRIEMQRLIEKLWHEQAFTALLVTHDVAEAVQLADRIILIEQGRIAADVRITLSRPRERDSGFAYFEKLILDRILLDEPPAEKKEKETYSI